MAHGVFHRILGAINLSELDLDVPSDRRLWESLYGKTSKGDLECLKCREDDPGCPQFMFLRLWKGRPMAVHYSTSIRHPTAPESPRHKARKERIARAAQRAGFTAELEAHGANGKRRTDVLVHGADGTQLGCEIQLSYATAQAVAKRTDIARADGLSPLWTTDDVSAPLIERTPWTRIDKMPLEAFSSGNALLIRGGVKDLKLKKCDSRNPLPCPDRGYGRCNQWHGTWAPTLGMHLDHLIGATAANEYLPLYIPAQQGRRRPAHLWVSAQDRERYLDATADTLADPEPGTVDDHAPAEPEHLPLSRECAYQQRLEEKEKRGPVARDTVAILPAGITLTDPPLPAPPQKNPRPLSSTAPASTSLSTSALPPLKRPVRQPPTTSASSLAAGPHCPPGEAGPCASCRQLTHRYGKGGNPLCQLCRARRGSSEAGG